MGAGSVLAVLQLDDGSSLRQATSILGSVLLDCMMHLDSVPLLVLWQSLLDIPFCVIVPSGKQTLRQVTAYRAHVWIVCCCREDAERAIRTLDGYGYDNLILHVEWAAPRADRG